MSTSRQLGTVAMLLLLSTTAVAADPHRHKDDHKHSEADANTAAALARDEHADESEHGEQTIELGGRDVRALGISIEQASAGVVRPFRALRGRVRPAQDQLAHLHPRFTGIVKEVRKREGDLVKAGETLAIIQSAQNLQQFPVESLIAGTVIERHATLGELASDQQPMFVVADLRTVWVDLVAYADDLASVKSDQTVRIYATDGRLLGESSVAFVSPVTDSQTQSRIVRAVLTNERQGLSPGEFVTGKLIVAETPVGLTVKSSALQRIDGHTVVFVKIGDRLERREVEVGESDGEVTEVRSGLSVGESYAAGNTFLLKAELEKSEAEHDH